MRQQVRKQEKKTPTRNKASFTLVLVIAALLLFGGCGLKVPQEIEAVTLPYVDENIVTTFQAVLPQRKFAALESENQRLMYKAMLLAIKDHETETLAIPGDLTEDEISVVYDAVVVDYPQFFEPSLTYNIVRNQTESGKVKSIACQLNYIENDPATAAVRRQALYDAVNAILAGAANIPDALQRERFFYESVIFTAQYDYSQTEIINIDLNTHTAYGCLVNGMTVCDGYAKAFALLCNYGGIACWQESGYLEGTTAHAWNAVKIDGKVYYCDPTLDDAENRYYDEDKTVLNNPDNPEFHTALPETATMLYYNVTRAEMSTNHIFKTITDPDDATDSATVTIEILPRFASRSELAVWMTQNLSDASSGAGFTVAVDFPIDKSAFAELISSAGVTNTCLFIQNGANTRYYIYVI